MPEVRVKHICILGASLDVDNLGVRALGNSLVQLLDRFAPGGAITFHYWGAKGGQRSVSRGDRTVTVEVRNCRLSPRSAPSEHMAIILAAALLYRFGFKSLARRNAWINSLVEADFVGDIRGGDSFSDIYGLRRFFIGSMPLATVLLVGRPYSMLPQTYGPFRGSLAKRLAAFFLTRASSIVTRDKQCGPIVRTLVGRTPIFCPDVAFTLEPEDLKTLPVKPAPLSEASAAPLIGVNVSGLLFSGGYTGRNMFGLRDDYKSLIDQVMVALLSRTSATVVIVPHLFGSEFEEEACEAVFQTFKIRYPGRVYLINQRLNERQVKAVIGKTDFFIGSRMHACIAALSQGVPALGLAYSDKFLGVFESADMAEAILDLRQLSTPDTVVNVLQAYERRPELAARLRRRLDSVDRDVRDRWTDMLSAAIRGGGNE